MNPEDGARVDVVEEREHFGSTFPASGLLGSRVGNYVVERSLARGGMGSVFVARHPQLGREVAVKFLDQDVSASRDFADRFLSEARMTASLRHPNIVDILDFGELDGRLYYVMELLRGRDLRSEMRVRGRFTTERAVRYLEQICSALAAAHAAGIVHRDLKPGNVLVLDGDPVRLKLVDFGVAKLMSRDGSQTSHGQVLGTPSHMAPEQALGEVNRITPQSDLYSLGVIAYQMLTGTPVFKHESPVMLMSMHVRDPVRPIRSVCPDVPEEIAFWVEACLAKQPKERPQSARLLADKLAAALRDAPRGPDSELLEVPALPSAPGREPFETDATSIYPRSVVAEPTNAAPAAPALAEPSIPAPEITGAHFIGSVSEPPLEGTLPPLGSAAHMTLNTLLLRLRTKQDFPAFAQNIGEVSKKADTHGIYSASQLSEALLKDYALTAKLLRVVNSMYANRFGGKIYSIKQAIVVLGFDRLRTLALSIGVFKSAPRGRQAARISDSAITSLVSGEIARNLAERARLDEEEAMVCAMFRNLGRHLVIVHLPELYDAILELVEKERLTERNACDRVLGTSYSGIGAAVAETWRLPARMQKAMVRVPGAESSVEKEEDRLSALSELAASLSDIVAGEPAETRDLAVSKLLARHRKLVSLDESGVKLLLASVKESFEERYTSLLGLDTKASRFFRNVDDATGPREPASVPPPVEIPKAAPGARHAVKPAAKPLRRIGGRVVAPLLLARQVVSSGSAEEPAEDADRARTLAKLRSQAKGLRAELARDRTAGDRVLPVAVKLFADHLGVSRVTVLAANAARDELGVRSGVHPDLDALTRELRFPLKIARIASDVFSNTYHSAKDIRVPDAFAPRPGSTVPVRYCEVLGSPAFALYVCTGRGNTVILLVEAESEEELPDASRVAECGELRPLIAQAAIVLRT